MPGNLGPLLRRLAKIANGKTVTRIKAALRDEAYQQLTKGFEELRDPYGDSWAPKVDGKPATLHQSGDLQASWKLDVVGNQVKATNPLPYAAIQQRRRKMVPEGADLGLWEEPLKQAARDAFDEDDE